MIRNFAHYNLISQNASLKLPKAILSTDPGNRHTPTTAPETLRALTGTCGMVRGPIKIPVIEKCFRPKATDRIFSMIRNFGHYNQNFQNASLKLPEAILSTDPGNRQQATGNRQQATGNRQQATGNRQQATGNRQQAIIHLL
jgi:hypothetical protein